MVGACLTLYFLDARAYHAILAFVVGDYNGATKKFNHSDQFYPHSNWPTTTTTSLHDSVLGSSVSFSRVQL
jgi:hypothetical protein